MAFVITYAKNAQSQIPLYCKTLLLFDVALKGMEWALARKPFRFDKVGGSVRGIPLGPFIHRENGQRHTVAAYFKIVDETQVDVLWLECRQIEQ